MNVVALPAAVGLFVIADPLTSVLFQRGEFGAAAAQQTSLAVRCFAVGLWSVAGVRVLIPAFYALEDTRTPVLVAVAAFFANVVGVVLFIGPLPVPPDTRLGAALARATELFAVVDLRHAGLALATSLSATVNLVLLCVALGRRSGGLDWRSWLAGAARTLLAALAMVPVVVAITGRVRWFDGTTPFGVRAAWLAVAVIAGAAVCIVAVLALGGPEVEAARAALRARRRGGGPDVPA